MEELKEDLIEENNIVISAKKKLKYFAIITVIFLLIDFIIIGIFLFMHNISRKGYTQYDLTKREMDVLVWYYDVYIPEYVEDDIKFINENRYNINKDEYELSEGPNAEKCVEAYNNLMFDEKNADNALKLANSYGITEENRMTVEWVLSHPREALKIFQADKKIMEETYIEKAADGKQYNIDIFITE